ncbi:MAG: FHA domain-containing protein [Candidatus Eisenbacteria bacterium]|nr:FHA domain-containing protein [Candidatus Eisenbacteria bacterium]
MLRLNLQLYRGPSELLADRTFEQETIRIGPDPGSDLPLAASDLEMPALLVEYRQGSYRIRGVSAHEHVRLNQARLPEGPEGAILSHEDLITFDRHSIVVRIYQAGGSELASPLWLLGVSGPLFGLSSELRASTIIGRSSKGPSEADIQIPVSDARDEGLSRQHARLTWTPGDVVEFRDISRHAEEIGSWLNRKRVMRGQILAVRPGDEIMIGPWGRHIFRLVRDGEWDFRPPRRVPAAAIVFGGWMARVLLPLAALLLLLAGGLFFSLREPDLGGGLAGAGLLGLIWSRVRLVRRRLAVRSQGRKLEGRIRV